MMHRHRRWCVGSVATMEELAQMLTARTWTLCSGFTVVGHPDYLFLNDATHEDGAGEYGVIKGGLSDALHRQIESITFSWCSAEQAFLHIRQTLIGEYDQSSFSHAVDLQGKLDTPQNHERCHLCA